MVSSKRPLLALLLSLLTIFRLASPQKLPCQTGTLKKRARLEAFTKPSHCCGGRPFNSKLSMCCLGKVLRRNQKKCCLDGTNAPAASRCMCYPSSNWVVSRMDQMEALQGQMTTMTENLDDRIATAQQKIVKKEKLLRSLDTRANTLYRQFLKAINVDENQDPGEINYIIRMVLFMNTNEELVNRAKSNARWLREGEERLLDYATDSTKPYEQISEENNVATPENLRRIRREAENTENAIEAARNATQAVDREVSSVLPGTVNRTEVVRLVLERSRVNRTIAKESASLLKIRNQLSAMQRMRSIVSSDRDLLLSLTAMLDAALNEALNMEAAKREEFPETEPAPFLEPRKKRSAASESPRGGPRRLFAEVINRIPHVVTEAEDLSSLTGQNSDNSSRTPMSSRPEGTSATLAATITSQVTRRARPKPNCNFSAWDLYATSFSQRLRLVTLDLQDLLSSNLSSSETNRTGTTVRQTRTERSFFANVRRSQGESEALTRKRRAVAEIFPDIELTSFQKKLNTFRLFREQAFPWFSSLKGRAISPEILKTEIISRIPKLPPRR